MIITLKMIILGSLFLVSGGSLFGRVFQGKLWLELLAGMVATVSVGYLAKDIIYQMVSQEIQLPSREVRSWQAHPGGWEGAICSGDCLAFTPDEQLLASGSEDNTIKLWQVSTGQLLNTWSDEHGVTSVAFSPDGQRLASGSDDKTIKLWQVRTGQLLKTLSGHKNGVNSVAFSPDGQQLASGSVDKTIKLWQVSTGQLLNTWSGDEGGVTSVAFSPDGRLAWGEWLGVIKLWE